MPDRDIRAMLQDITEQTKQAYNDAKSGNSSLPEWDKGKYVFTIKNYEIGTYSGGTLKLKGEK